MSVRRCTHAGSWYNNSGEKLTKEIESHLSHAKSANTSRMIFAPHAGFQYSAATAAVAFKQVDWENINTVFIAGPSHHEFYRRVSPIRRIWPAESCFIGCSVTCAKTWETPIMDLTVDTEIVDKLKNNENFKVNLPIGIEENEHSMELIAPFVAYFARNDPNLGERLKIVPIMVGDGNLDNWEKCAEILLPYVQDEHNLFVFSTDFVHWGKDYNFTYFDPAHGSHPCNSIEFLDKKAFECLMRKDPREFEEYLQRYKTLVCGQNPLKIMLYLARMISNSQVCVLDYTKSDECYSEDDFGVSYAGGIVFV